MNDPATNIDDTTHADAPGWARFMDDMLGIADLQRRD